VFFDPAFLIQNPSENPGFCLVFTLPQSCSFAGPVHRKEPLRRVASGGISPWHALPWNFPWFVTFIFSQIVVHLYLVLLRSHTSCPGPIPPPRFLFFHSVLGHLQCRTPPPTDPWERLCPFSSLSLKNPPPFCFLE